MLFEQVPRWWDQLRTVLRLVSLSLGDIGGRTLTSPFKIKASPGSNY